MKNLNRIFLVSGQFLEVPVSVFKSSDRRRVNVEARFMLMSILHNSFKMSFTDISRAMLKNHATVMYGIEQIEKLMDVYPEIKQKYKNLRAHIYENGLHNPIYIQKYCSLVPFSIKKYQ